MALKHASPLGKWVDQLVVTVFFQPDDKLSTKAIHDHFSRDLKVRINGAALDCASYASLIADARAKNEMSVQTNDELLASKEESDPSGATGSVAHLSHFTLKDRETGIEKKESTVTLATVAVVDGQRKLVELTEVYRSA